MSTLFQEKLHPAFLWGAWSRLFTTPTSYRLGDALVCATLLLLEKPVGNANCPSTTLTSPRLLQNVSKIAGCYTDDVKGASMVINSYLRKERDEARQKRVLKDQHNGLRFRDVRRIHASFIREAGNFA
ncbi:12142_t:CDS:2, partial [Ambispora leptoticha]